MLYQSDAVLCLAEHGKGSSGRKPNQITVPLSLKDEPEDWSDRENKQPNNPWLPQIPHVTADGRTEEPVSQEGRIKLNSFFFFPSQLEKCPMDLNRAKHFSSSKGEKMGQGNWKDASAILDVIQLL